VTGQVVSLLGQVGNKLFYSLVQQADKAAVFQVKIQDLFFFGLELILQEHQDTGLADLAGPMDHDDIIGVKEPSYLLNDRSFVKRGCHRSLFL